MDLIWGKRKAEYICEAGWTTQITLIPNENFSSTRNGRELRGMGGTADCSSSSSFNKPAFSRFDD
jgi:hypothetical protein